MLRRVLIGASLTVAIGCSVPDGPTIGDTGQTWQAVEDGDDATDTYVLEGIVESGSELAFAIEAPADKSTMVVSLEGDFGDADLMTSAGDALPTVEDADCRSENLATDERCMYLDVHAAARIAGDNPVDGEPTDGEDDGTAAGIGTSPGTEPGIDQDTAKASTTVNIVVSAKSQAADFRLQVQLIDILGRAPQGIGTSP